VIGLIILAAAFAVLTLVLNFLGFSGGVTGSDNVFQNIRFINEDRTTGGGAGGRSAPFYLNQP